MRTLERLVFNSALKTLANKPYPVRQAYHVLTIYHLMSHLTSFPSSSSRTDLQLFPQLSSLTSITNTTSGLPVEQPHTMLARTLLRRAAALPLRSTTSHIRRYTGPLPGLPQSSASSVSNTSATNATPPAVEDTEYAAALTESVEEGERARKLQAPNREKTWSRSQQAREVAMTGPRFEQTNMELQVELPTQKTY